MRCREVFLEDFLSLPRIVYLLDVSIALPRLQKLLTAQGNLTAAFRARCSEVILQTFGMNLQVGVVISLYFRPTFMYILFPLLLFFYQFVIKLCIFKYFNTNIICFYLVNKAHLIYNRCVLFIKHRKTSMTTVYICIYYD